MDGPNLGPGPSAARVMPMTAMRDRRGQMYLPAVGPRLRVLLFIIFIAFAVLGATGVLLTDGPNDTPNPSEQPVFVVMIGQGGPEHETKQGLKADAHAGPPVVSNRYSARWRQS